MKLKIISIALLGLGLILVASAFINWSSGDADIGLEIDKARVIMPAAHHVYSEPDVLEGKYYLFKSKVTNNSKQKLEDVTVSYRIPGFIEWTSIKTIGEMFPGQSAAVVCYPKFPESVTERTTASTEKAQIKIEWDGMNEDDTIEEEFGFKLASRKEFMFTSLPLDEVTNWYDLYDNVGLLSCFVTPNDPIVQYYTQNIQQKILKGEDASVQRDPKEGVRFIKGIFEATKASNMVYSGTKMIPSDLKDITMASQENRLPREVITGNTGLCLELSLMYASVMMNAGLEPVIYLVPGHAYPGFKLRGEYHAIEATDIGGEGLNYTYNSDQAYERGMKSLQECFQQIQQGNPKYQIIDIAALHQAGVKPMSLKDDAFLRKKVDDIAASWFSQDNSNDLYLNQPTQMMTMEGNSTQMPLTSSYNISIPAGWQTYNRPEPSLPQLSVQSYSPDSRIGISIWDFQTKNPQQALQTLQQVMQNLGLSVQIQTKGDYISGMTNQSPFMGKLVNTSDGIQLITVGSSPQDWQALSPQIQQLVNSIK